MFVLYAHYKELEGNGITGIVITVLMYGAILMLNGLLFYNYLVFLHMDGRIIDIYMRVTARNDYFFVPLDNEVSLRYLNWVITKVKLENKKHARNGGITRRKVFSITSHKVTDKNYNKEIRHISIYRKRDDGKLALYRHFMKTGEGTICELEEDNPFTVDNHPLLEKWPPYTKRRISHKHQALPGVYQLDMNQASDKDEEEVKEE